MWRVEEEREATCESDVSWRVIEVDSCENDMRHRDIGLCYEWENRT